MRRIWRLLLYVRPYALYSLASVVLMAIVGAMAAFRILLVKPIFDNVLSPDAPAGTRARVPHPAYGPRHQSAAVSAEPLSQCLDGGRGMRWLDLRY